MTIGWTSALSTSLGSSGDYLMNNPPAVVWVPSDDQYDETPQSNRPAQAVARSVRTCWMGFDARCWAVYTNLPLATRPAVEDWSATEQLKNQLIVALQKKVYGFYRLGAGRWQFNKGRGEGGEELQFGRAYILPVWIATPVVDMAGIGQQTQLIALPETRQIATTNGTTTDAP